MTKEQKRILRQTLKENPELDNKFIADGVGRMLRLNSQEISKSVFKVSDNPVCIYVEQLGLAGVVIPMDSQWARDLDAAYKYTNELVPADYAYGGQDGRSR